MIESPIRRKQIHYPKDFLPALDKKPQNKRFTFNQDYQIELYSIRKYQKSIEEQPSEPQNAPQSISLTINPQKAAPTCKQLQEDSPLDHRTASKKPSLDEDLLKKPRFCINDNEQIEEKEDLLLESSMSPGSIRKQREDIQGPLPLEETCKVDHFRANAQTKRLMNSCIKYKSSSEFQNRSWLSTEKDIMNKFKESRSKNQINELPKLDKSSGNLAEEQFAAAKEQYKSFRRRQQFLGQKFGKVSSLISSIKKKEQGQPSQFPKFQSSQVQRLKQEINMMVRAKKGFNKKQASQSEESDNQTDKQIEQKRTNKKKMNNYQNHNEARQMPQLLVSYRSSLSYLKDLFSKSKQLPCFKLIVKIPKLFVEKLIFKEQDRQELYETAKQIFQQLRIPYENLVIKKYTNCTMLIARNICMIWHFDGRRYLGGWQSEYLDEGVKHGLGLEWEPKKYVYYGQFMRGKKHGLGIYKNKNEDNYVGYWSKGQRLDSSNLIQIDHGFEQNRFQDEQQPFQQSGSRVDYAYQYL